MKKYWKIILLILSPFVGGLIYKISVFINIPEEGSVAIGVCTALLLAITLFIDTTIDKEW